MVSLTTWTVSVVTLLSVAYTQSKLGISASKNGYQMGSLWSHQSASFCRAPALQSLSLSASSSSYLFFYRKKCQMEGQKKGMRSWVFFLVKQDGRIIYFWLLVQIYFPSGDQSPYSFYLLVYNCMYNF